MGVRISLSNNTAAIFEAERYYWGQTRAGGGFLDHTAGAWTFLETIGGIDVFTRQNGVQSLESAGRRQLHPPLALTILLGFLAQPAVKVLGQGSWCARPGAQFGGEAPRPVEEIDRAFNQDVPVTARSLHFFGAMPSKMSVQPRQPTGRTVEEFDACGEEFLEKKADNLRIAVVLGADVIQVVLSASAFWVMI